VQRGQKAWLAGGGQQLGSAWGHGSYLAPDWSADWLHREAIALREILAQRDFGTAFAHLQPSQQAQLDARLKTEMRRNTYDATSGVISLSADRAAAVAKVAQHYIDLFGNDAALDALRGQYAMPAGVYQARASISEGVWFARSPAFVHSSLMETFVWLRVPGGIVFALGTLFLAIFAGRLLIVRRNPAAVASANAFADKTM
jgi:nitric oxide reductase large subunit